MNRISEGHPFDAILPAPFGGLGVRFSGHALAELVFLPPSVPLQLAAPPAISALPAIANALSAYFENAQHRFCLSSLPPGTPFRQRVWAALCEIPVGTVITYGELARQVGSAPRAVGQAVGDNPWPILIPCHRVVSATGLGGFNHHQDGFPLDVKRWLLRHEGVL